MPVQAQAGGAVVRQQFLAHARRRQGHLGLVRAAGQQRQPSLDPGHGPARGIAMAGQRLQRPGFGQQRARPGVQARAQAQVTHIDEGALRARGHDRLGRRLRQSGHLAQAQPQRRLPAIVQDLCCASAREREGLNLRRRIDFGLAQRLDRRFERLDRPGIGVHFDKSRVVFEMPGGF